MRTAFIKILTELAQQDENIYLLTGDLGYSVFEGFAEKFPKRFLNCGVAEQNMMGMAAGLALQGKKVYVYSIIPFVTMRCFEQIRDDICYQNLNVKIIGVGSGFAYGPLGATHHAIEDLAILRTLPNMTVLSPADPLETRELMIKAHKSNGPAYFRLNRGNDKVLYDSRPEIEIGKPSILMEGCDGAIISTGVSAVLGIDVINLLKKEGKKFRLISMHTLKPINNEYFMKLIKDMKFVFSLEEHNIIGGLGGAISEILAESKWKGGFKRFGIPDEYCKFAGESDYLREHSGLASGKIANEIIKFVKQNG